MAVDLNAIHRALAARILAGLARDTNVQPFPIPPSIYPSITIYPDSPYLEYFSTFGPNGYIDMRVKIKIEVEGDAESMAIKMCAYLGVGTGFTSSIFDAIRADKTLGGVVEDCVPSSAEWDAENEPGTAWIPVQILVKKLSAQP